MVRDYIPSIRPQGSLLCAVAINQLTLVNRAWKGGWNLGSAGMYRSSQYLTG